MPSEAVNHQEKFALRIIEEQAIIVGSIAWEVADQVSGVRINIQTHSVNLEGDPKKVLEQLVAQYESVFGPASREVCRDAVKPLLAQISPEEIPAVLQ